MIKFRLLFILLAASYCAFSQNKLDSFFAKSKITGVQIVAVNGGRTDTFFYGKSNSSTAEKISGATVFQAASLSKVLLAYITMRMIDKNLISLDTPLYHYFQYDRIKTNESAQKVTARMVLHHQTGFPNWATNPGSKQWFTSNLPTQFEPGSSWFYSGEGFMFLQYAVESILKQSLETIATQEVFMPLNMKSSSFLWQPMFAATGAYGHDKNGEPTGRNKPFLPAAAYSLLTTAADYNRFLQAVINGNGLSKKTHQLMLNDTINVKKLNTKESEAAMHISWALGVGVQRNELGKAIWHWGDNGDFKCFFLALQGQNKSLVYFTNCENGLDALPTVLDYYFGKNTWWAIQWLDKD